jgi:hypothetical protein
LKDVITAKYTIGDVNVFALGTRYLGITQSWMKYGVRKQFLLYLELLMPFRTVCRWRSKLGSQCLTFHNLRFVVCDFTALS